VARGSDQTQHQKQKPQQKQQWQMTDSDMELDYIDNVDNDVRENNEENTRPDKYANLVEEELKQKWLK
jgi:hypothetical protein